MDGSPDTFATAPSDLPSGSAPVEPEVIDLTAGDDVNVTFSHSPGRGGRGDAGLVTPEQPPRRRPELCPAPPMVHRQPKLRRLDDIVRDERSNVDVETPRDDGLGDVSGSSDESDREPKFADDDWGESDSDDSDDGLGSDSDVYPLSDSLGDDDLADFEGVPPDERGVYSTKQKHEDEDERRHLEALAGRKPGDVWAMYDDTGLPRVYAMLLAPDARLMINDRPARWRVAYLSGRDCKIDRLWRTRHHAGEQGGAGVMWQTEGPSKVWGSFARGYGGLSWRGWVLGKSLDREFSHPASIAEEAAREIILAARSYALWYFNFHRLDWRPGDDLLIPYTHKAHAHGFRMTPAAVIVPRVGQVWTMTELRSLNSRGRSSAPSVGRPSRPHVTTPEGATIYLVPEDIVVVRDIKVGDVNSMPHASGKVAPEAWVRAGRMLSASTYTVEKLERLHNVGDASSFWYAPTGHVFDGCWFQHFDYQVPVFESTRDAELGIDLLRLDNLALEVMLKDGADKPESEFHSEPEEDDRHQFFLHHSRNKADKSYNAWYKGKPKMPKPPPKPPTPPKPRRLREKKPARAVTRKEGRPRKAVDPKYPRCEGCGETEWHFSRSAPGEPDHGAPVVIRCSDASCVSQYDGSRSKWWHPQCIAPDHIPGPTHDFRTDQWTCQVCALRRGNLEVGSSPLIPLQSDNLNQWSEVEREWHTGSPEDGVVMRVKRSDGKRLWLSADCVKSTVPDEILARWLLSPTRLGTMESMLTGLIGPTDEPVRGSPGVVKRVWRFRSNGQYFGVTQYLGAFTEDELKQLEADVDAALAKEIRANENAVAAGQCPPPQLHASHLSNRYKMFYGYRYEYNKHVPKNHVSARGEWAERKIPKLFQDVPPMPPWVQALATRAREVGAVPRDDFVDMSVVNVYSRAAAKLSVHMDPSVLFKRPIISVRCFGAGTLSFCAKGQFEGHRIHKVDQPRGAITVMEGYAANAVTHAVLSTDVKEKGCSVMLRGCVETAVEEAKSRSVEAALDLRYPRMGMVSVPQAGSRFPSTNKNKDISGEDENKDGSGEDENKHGSGEDENSQVY